MGIMIKQANVGESTLVLIVNHRTISKPYAKELVTDLLSRLGIPGGWTDTPARSLVMAIVGPGKMDAFFLDEDVLIRVPLRTDDISSLVGRPEVLGGEEMLHKTIVAFRESDRFDESLIKVGINFEGHYDKILEVLR